MNRDHSKCSHPSYENIACEAAQTNFDNAKRGTQRESLDSLSESIFFTLYAESQDLGPSIPKPPAKDWFIRVVSGMIARHFAPPPTAKARFCAVCGLEPESIFHSCDPTSPWPVHIFVACEHKVFVNGHCSTCGYKCPNQNCNNGLVGKAGCSICGGIRVRASTQLSEVWESETQLMARNMVAYGRHLLSCISARSEVEIDQCDCGFKDAMRWAKQLAAVATSCESAAPAACPECKSPDKGMRNYIPGPLWPMRWTCKNAWHEREGK